jgi:hypothetical protein
MFLKENSIPLQRKQSLCWNYYFAHCPDNVWPDVTMSLSADHSTPDGWFMVSQISFSLPFFPMYAFHWLQMNLQKYSPSIQLLSFSVYFSNSYFIDKCKEICFIYVLTSDLQIHFTTVYILVCPTGHFSFFWGANWTFLLDILWVVRLSFALPSATTFFRTRF